MISNIRIFSGDVKECCYEQTALNTEMAEKYFFTEHTEDYFNVFVWVDPGTHTLT